MDPDLTSHEAERRSRRVRAQIPIQVTSLDPAFPFSEPCYTLVINTQGCGVRCSQSLEVGLPVEIKTPTRQVTARVANGVPLGAEGKFWLVGLALDEPGNVWGIHPAPADWGEEKSVEATAGVAAAPAATIQDSAKKDEWPYSQFSRRGEFHPGRR
jgi:hypothetical protein